MNRSVILLLAVSSFLAARPAVAEDWTETKSQEGNFKVQMPTESEYSASPLGDDEDSAPLHIFASEVEDGTLAYMVMYNDYPSSLLKAKSADQILDDVCKGVESRLTDAKTTKSKVVLSGHPGRDLEMHGKQDGKETYFAWRVYLVKNRLYQVGIVRFEKPLDKQDAKKFLDSFQFLRT